MRTNPPPTNNAANAQAASNGGASVASPDQAPSQTGPDRIKTLAEAKQRRIELFNKASSPAVKKIFAHLEVMHYAKISVDQHGDQYKRVLEAVEMLAGDYDIDEELLKKLNLADLKTEDRTIKDTERWAVCEDLKIQRDPRKGVPSVRRQHAARMRQSLVGLSRRIQARSPSNPDGVYEGGSTLDEIASPEVESSSRSAPLDDLPLISIARSAAKNREASLELILSLFDDPKERREIEEAAQTVRTRDEAAGIRPTGNPDRSSLRRFFMDVAAHDERSVQRQSFASALEHMRTDGVRAGAEHNAEELDAAALRRLWGNREGEVPESDLPPPEDVD